jgi:hypothetical protein
VLPPEEAKKANYLVKIDKELKSRNTAETKLDDGEKIIGPYGKFTDSEVVFWPS